MNECEIKAMILCAGHGTRMGELTKKTPKPMLPVAGIPILEHTIKNLQKVLITEIVMNLHYLSNQIEAYFADGSKWNAKITYSFEEKPLGTAGGVKNVENYFQDCSAFIVIYGDLLIDFDFRKLIDFHLSKKTMATIVLHKRSKSNSVVEMDNSGRIYRFLERPSEKILEQYKHNEEKWVNSGIYCFNPKIFDFIPQGKECDFPRDIFSNLVEKQELYGFPLKGFRCAIDTPDRYEKVQMEYIEYIKKRGDV